MAFVSVVQAQALDWGEEYAKRIKSTEAVSPLGDEVFGDQINLFNGTTSFSVTDISLPGNSALPVRLTRTFDTQDVTSGRPIGVWDIDAPRVSAIHPAGAPWAPLQRCSTVAAPPSYESDSYTFTARDYWSGTQLRAPNGGGDLLAINSDPKLVTPTLAGTFKWATKGGWFFTCLPTLQSGEGEGFVGHAPDGTKYTFDWMTVRGYNGISKKDPSRLNGTLINRSNVRIYATRVEDRFGNWVAYDWTGGRLNRIHANDGREITLNYAADNGRLLTATAAGRIWTYEYLPPSNLALSAVVNPDGSRWQYGRSGDSINRIAYSPNPHAPPQYVSEHPAACVSMSMIYSQARATFTITHPSGAQAEYTFAPLRHGRTNVPYDCMEGSDDDWRSDYNNFSVFHDVMSLKSKRITGPGLVDGTYAYTYTSLEGGYAPQDPYNDALTGATPPPHYKYVTVTEPDGTEMVNTFGKDYGLNEGQLLRTEVRRSGVAYKAVTNAYVSEAEVPAQPFPGYVGSNLVPYGDFFNTAALRPQRSTTIAQDGATFSSSTNTFDAQARPLSVTQSSSLGYARTRVTSYHDNLSAWVLGQAKTVTQTAPAPSVVISQVDYDAADLPWKTYASGLLQQTLAYYTDGTLKTVTDPLNHTTTLSDWKRGIPRLITFADAKTKSAAVHDAGWIDSVTDENGYTTNYGHDAMGRLTSMAHPTGDTSVWNTTTQTFAPVATAEYGIPAGHWKQTVSTGNARKATYFDALWRPLVTESYDNANKAGTLSQTVTRYDASGHAIFQSYPLNAVTDYAAITQGTRTWFDALDRATRVEQDSELGILATRIEYLPGFQRRTTNPRNAVTTESFQAFDVPSYDAPVLIKTPVSTATIERDGFGKPAATTRAGP